MAKPAKVAKNAGVEVSPRVVNRIIGDILSHYADLESERGKFMNRARRIREGIQSVIDGATARGIAPKITKLVIRIEQTQQKLQSLMAELDSEERKDLRKIVVAHGNKAQLSLFNDLPPAPKPEQPVLIETKSRKKHPEAAASKPNGDEKKLQGASGADIDAAIKAGEASDALH